MKRYIEIENVFAREVLDSRGNPTIEVEVETDRHRIWKGDSAFWCFYWK